MTATQPTTTTIRAGARRHEQPPQHGETATRDEPEQVVYDWDGRSKERLSLVERLDLINRLVNDEWAKGTVPRVVRDAMVSLIGMTLRFFDQQRMTKDQLDREVERGSEERLKALEAYGRAQSDAHLDYTKNLVQILGTVIAPLSIARQLTPKGKGKADA